MPFTLFDNRVDRISINPRKQAFEKVSALLFASSERALTLAPQMISGMCKHRSSFVSLYSH